MRYKYTIHEDFNIYFPELSGVNFICDWGSIENGLITIKKEYSWNGCTLAFDCRHTYKAGLIHDFLYQFRPISRTKCDRIFYLQLKRDGFSLSFIYYVAVRLFGFLFYSPKYLSK